MSEKPKYQQLSTYLILLETLADTDKVFEQRGKTEVICRLLQHGLQLWGILFTTNFFSLNLAFSCPSYIYFFVRKQAKCDLIFFLRRLMLLI